MAKAAIAPEEHDFVAAIRAAPELDEPRLACAQWLRARGDPRGELIEVQCALARITDTRSPERLELLQRERALITAHGAEWAQRVGLKRKALPWTRGFVERLDATGRVFAKALPQLLDLEPVSQLCLTSLGADELEALGRDDRIAFLETLELADSIGQSPMHALLASDRLRGLRRLGIADSALLEASAAAIARNRALGSLEELELRRTPVGEDGLRCIGTSETLTSLRSFLFEGNIERSMAVTFLGSPLVRRLERLALGGGFVTAPGFERSPRLGDEGAELLARSASDRLEDLTLSAQYIGARGLEAVTSSLSSLRSLDLRLNEIRESGLAVLANARLPRLAALGLGQTDLDEAGIQVLARATGLPSLTSLVASEGDLSARALDALATSTLGSRLETLNLRASGVGASALRALAQRGMLGRLHRLVLANCPVGDEGARVLANTAARLIELNLYEAGIGDAGATAIASADGFGAIETIDLRRNRVGAAGAIALLEARSLFWSRVDLRSNPLGEGVLDVDRVRPFPMTSFG